MTRPCALVGIAGLVALLATPAQATPIVEQTLVATGGDVVVTFVSNGAWYVSELYLDGLDSNAIFNSSTTAEGTSINLGNFDTDVELIFKLLVLQTGDLFYTGDAARNVDGLVHAVVSNVAGQVLVGFEDIFGGGDRDYNDLVFAFTNVSAVAPGGSGPSGAGGGSTVPTAVDEPGTLLLFGSGLAGLVLMMKRRTT